MGRAGVRAVGAKTHRLPQVLSPRPAMHALEIEDLTKRYPTGTEALKKVSLAIEEGGFFGLPAPNGAGKSTLIHCTAGLAQPTAGSIRVFGHDAVHHYGE